MQKNYYKIIQYKSTENELISFQSLTIAQELLTVVI